MTQKAFDALCVIGTIALLMGFIDWLWLFGIENSKSYTRYALAAYLAK